MNVVKSSFEPWTFKKSNILAKYTTVEKLSITSSFLTPLSNIVKDNLLSSKDKGTVSDKIKERLEMLDQFEDENMQEMANLTQQEYIKRIEELNSALLKAWNEDDRVKSLKIVIQVLFFPTHFNHHCFQNNLPSICFEISKLKQIFFIDSHFIGSLLII